MPIQTTLLVYAQHMLNSVMVKHTLRRCYNTVGGPKKSGTPNWLIMIISSYYIYEDKL